jgi:hypothetical protein
MFRTNFLFALACALVLATSHGFAPQHAAFRPASSIQGASPPTKKAKMMNSKVVLRMSEEGEPKPSVSADGTFYDDEVSNILSGAEESVKYISFSFAVLTQSSFHPLGKHENNSLIPRQLRMESQTV